MPKCSGGQTFNIILNLERGATNGDELAMAEYKYRDIMADQEYHRISKLVILPRNSLINVG